MAFAPHVEIGYKRILGSFIEKECGHHFEFSRPRDGEITPWADYPVKVWVGDGNFRWARVLKTVVHIVVDEGADGQPVADRWEIKRHVLYTYERGQ